MVKGQVPAVNLAVRVIEFLVAEWPQPVPVGRFVSDLGINRSTCYNVLATLQESNWVLNLGDRAGWTLGSRLLTLTGASEKFLGPILGDELENLGRALGIVVYAAKEDADGGYTVVARSDPNTGIRLTVGVGDRFPYSSPALMGAFWAFRRRDAFADLVSERPLEMFTEHTLHVDDALRELDAIADRGYSRVIRQFTGETAAVGAPVVDARGRVTLVICGVALTTDLNETNIDRVGELIRDAAARTSAMLGGVPSRGGSTISTGTQPDRLAR